VAAAGTVSAVSVSRNKCT